MYVSVFPAFTFFIKLKKCWARACVRNGLGHFSSCTGASANKRLEFERNACTRSYIFNFLLKYSINDRVKDLCQTIV